MKPAERYTITALRLINFHNFTNVTIPLPHGGHLFLLGDNGSGKTTVLDALHAILTGDDLDYNAAARIGAKVRGEGRRSQGIVMRLNTEARSEENPNGLLRPRGGITYAAMEYTLPSGDRHSCGIALEAHALDQARRTLAAAERTLTQAQGRVQAIAEAEDFLVDLNDRWHAARAEAEAAQHAIEQCEEQSVTFREAMVEAEDRRTQAVRLRDDLDARIQSAGLAGLNERIAKAQREEREAQEALDHLNQQIGRAQGDRDAAERRRSALLDELAQREAQLRALCEGLALAPEAVAEACAQVDETTPWAERAGELKAQLRQHASAPRLAHYGFIFDEGANLVADRSGHPVSECLAEQQASVAKTQRLVSDRLVELNRQIFTEGFLDALSLQVKLMQQMERKARALLVKRQFGNSRYSFTIEPREDYRPLIAAITDPTAPGAEDTLRAFIQSHEADIISAVSGDIPPDLDYRNWFRYRLKIQPLHGRAITVDNKTRSVGSGGEQAVPNYLLILTLAAFLYEADAACRLSPLLFDEAFYGIDAARRDELLAFAEDLGLQLFVASPDQDGLKQALHASTSLLVIKDPAFNVHVIPYHWSTAPEQQELAL